MGNDVVSTDTQTTMNDLDRPIKRCFVTVGATASFTSLIRNALSTSFLKTLYRHGYTHLRIQYGKDGKKSFEDYAWLLPDNLKQQMNLDISGFDFRTDGLHEEMLAAKRGLTLQTGDAEKDESQGEKDVGTKATKAGLEGCVISHAGSGSILDALRLEVPIVVVPNPDLLDNHQLELAEVLAEQNYVVHGDLSELSQSIPAVEELRQKRKVWPPVVGTNKKTPRQALASILDDELGWVD